jgi:hypothetical protein
MTYIVFRYQWPEMAKPRWAAKRRPKGQRWTDFVDRLPASVLAKPGLIEVEAKNAREAIQIVKRARGF